MKLFGALTLLNCCNPSENALQQSGMEHLCSVLTSTPIEALGLSGMWADLKALEVCVSQREHTLTM